jgi:hypothetical protein
LINLKQLKEILLVMVKAGWKKENEVIAESKLSLSARNELIIKMGNNAPNTHELNRKLWDMVVSTVRKVPKPK